jgi:hypothetical protein
MATVKMVSEYAHCSPKVIKSVFPYIPLYSINPIAIGATSLADHSQRSTGGNGVRPLFVISLRALSAHTQPTKTHMPMAVAGISILLDM